MRGRRTGEGQPAGWGRPAIACRESAGGADACTPGQTLFTFDDAATYEISTFRSPFTGTIDVHVVNVPALPPCENLRWTVSLDMGWAGVPGPGTASDVRAYLNTRGLDLPSRAFISGPSPLVDAKQLACPNPGAPLDGAFYTKSFVDFLGDTSHHYLNFAGPLPLQSVYFWCPTGFPDFFEGDWFIKNLHIEIVTI